MLLLFAVCKKVLLRWLEPCDKHNFHWNKQIISDCDFLFLSTSKNPALCVLSFFPVWRTNHWSLMLLVFFSPAEASSITLTLLNTFRHFSLSRRKKEIQEERADSFTHHDTVITTFILLLLSHYSALSRLLLPVPTSLSPNRLQK